MFNFRMMSTLWTFGLSAEPTTPKPLRHGWQRWMKTWWRWWRFLTKLMARTVSSRFSTGDSSSCSAPRCLGTATETNGIFFTNYSERKSRVPCEKSINMTMSSQHKYLASSPSVKKVSIWPWVHNINIWPRPPQLKSINMTVSSQHK